MDHINVFDHQSFVLQWNLFKDTLNKGYNTFNIKDKFCGPYTNTILPLKEDNLSITVKLHQISWSQSVCYLEVPLYMV